MILLGKNCHQIHSEAGRQLETCLLLPAGLWLKLTGHLCSSTCERIPRQVSGTSVSEKR